MEKYKLYQSNLIIQNHPQFIKECDFLYKNLIPSLKSQNPTWDYDKYNVFNLTGSSILFYQLFQELNYNIRSFIGDNRPLWLQCWLNYHDEEELEKTLHTHGHDETYHGYISINPQNTNTIFRNGLIINNQIGQTYIGPGNDREPSNTEWDHYVKINQPYKGKRITLGFDISCYVGSNLHPSFIPLL